MSTHPRPAARPDAPDLLAPVLGVYAWTRHVFAAHALAVNALRFDESTSPVGVVLVTLAMVAVSLLTHWAYAQQRWRQPWVLCLDVAVTLLLLGSGPMLMGQEQMNRFGMPITALWHVTASAGVAICFGAVWGAVAVSAVAVVVLSQHPAGGVLGASLAMTMILTTVMVGRLVQRLQRLMRDNWRMHASAAATAERERLARIVHDGVLQVLAMVARDGPRLGARGALLARNAAEQETQLRALLQQETEDEPGEGEERDWTHRNLATVLDRHGGPRVTVSTAASGLLMDAERAMEVDAAVGEALANVARHAGPEARAWVFCERDGADIVISVRDNGVGASEAEIAAALERGRMGMRHSITGRLSDLGGSASIRTSPGRGLEWEFRIPVEQPTVF